MKIDERKTKIVCTIGPSSLNLDMLVKMMNAGMNVARINFSHGDDKNHIDSINIVSSAALKASKYIVECILFI